MPIPGGPWMIRIEPFPAPADSTARAIRPSSDSRSSSAGSLLLEAVPDVMEAAGAGVVHDV